MIKLEKDKYYGAKEKGLPTDDGIKTTTYEISCNAVHDKTYSLKIDGINQNWIKEEFHSKYEIIELRGDISKGYGSSSRKSSY